MRAEASSLSCWSPPHLGILLFTRGTFVPDKVLLSLTDQCDLQKFWTVCIQSLEVSCLRTGTPNQFLLTALVANRKAGRVACQANSLALLGHWDRVAVASHQTPSLNSPEWALLVWSLSTLPLGEGREEVMQQLLQAASKATGLITDYIPHLVDCAWTFLPSRNDRLRVCRLLVAASQTLPPPLQRDFQVGVLKEICGEGAIAYQRVLREQDALLSADARSVIRSDQAALLAETAKLKPRLWSRCAGMIRQIPYWLRLAVLAFVGGIALLVVILLWHKYVVPRHVDLDSTNPPSDIQNPARTRSLAIAKTDQQRGRLTPDRGIMAVRTNRKRRAMEVQSHHATKILAAQRSRKRKVVTVPEARRSLPVYSQLAVLPEFPRPRLLSTFSFPTACGKTYRQLPPACKQKSQARRKSA